MMIIRWRNFFSIKIQNDKNSPHWGKNIKIVQYLIGNFGRNSNSGLGGSKKKFKKRSIYLWGKQSSFSKLYIFSDFRPPICDFYD